jgi:glycosyltransferase involved in cell wall biosynthesis
VPVVHATASDTVVLRGERPSHQRPGAAYLLLMRVLLINKFVHVTGGADLHCLWLAEALRERGHDVRFLSTWDEGNLDRHGVFIPATVTHANRDGIPLRARPGIAASALWNPAAADATRRLIATWRPDVVHAHKLYPQLSVAPVVEAARAGVPVVQTLHDFELVSAAPLDARGGWRDRDDLRASYRLLNSATHPVRRRVHVRRVTSFVAVSRFVAAVYARHAIAATVLPNFVPPRLGESKLDTSQRSGIAFVGRLTADKGIFDVLALAAALPDVPVTIVGTGTLEAEVRSRAVMLPNLTLTGFVAHPEAARIVAGSQLVVLPSRCHEAAGLVAVEAMGAGTPVVAYASGGLAEYVSDAGAGLVVPRDPVSLATACERLLGDESSRAAMSARGIDAAQTTHGRERYVDRIEQLYSSLAPSSG